MSDSVGRVRQSLRPRGVTAAAGPVVAGLTRFSTCDWPGRIVATAFLQGCPLDCVYCHNPELISPTIPGTIPWIDVLDFMAGRLGLLDGMVLSGGEPCRQDLRGAIAQIKNLGFAVGLHTSGAYPHRLEQILPQLDWVGLDVKALPEDYGRITGVPAAGERMTRSLRLVLDSGVDHQLRTTWGPGVMTETEIERIEEWLASQGAGPLVRQEVRIQGTRPEFVLRYRADLDPTDG